MKNPKILKKRPRYNAKGWLLCECVECGRLNHVEPHGITASCKCAVKPTPHFLNEDRVY